MSGLALLAVFAHPDDEAFGPGGTLAKYSSQGVNVWLATATRGEAGQSSGIDVSGPEELAAIREKELECSCQTLGVHRLCFLGYVDGMLANADLEDVEQRIVRLIREQRPQVMITFGPEGIYGHPDHITIGEVATRAFRSAAVPTRFPHLLHEGLAPFAPSKLYHITLPKQFAEMLDPRLQGTDEDKITAIVDTSAFGEQKWKAVTCHRTQRADWGRIGQEQVNAMVQREYYVLADSLVGWPQGHEQDLFERVAQPGAASS